MYTLIDSQSILVCEGESTIVIAASDLAFESVRRYIVDEHGADFATVRQLATDARDAVKSAVADAFSVVDGDTDGDESATGEPAYRIVHGDPVEEIVFTTVLRLTRENSDLAPLGKFLSRLDRNPSEASRSQLFGWLKAGGFTITTDGMIVGYKSVRADGLSAHSGREPVTVQHQDGSTETVDGHVPYPVGATVWMDRNLVDSDRDSACSVGLHVGTFGYAKRFSTQMLVVLVDPADVVSVPTDCNAQKMRVCRLHVAALHDGEQIADAVIEHIRTIPDFDAVEEYGKRPENNPRATFGVVVSFDDSDDDDDQDDDHDDHDGDDLQDDQHRDEHGEGAEDEIAVPLGETPCVSGQWPR
ncbi:Uncharacterised protein [Mycobacteroides abscessus subsp. abscessus]|uniref:hypothetical protein n=1 Tax=Mycobacteroides abscessus TaxID=36809 RepID=UPI00092BE9B6|nr:hypothetical protein [Mycobacteroides abscessus]SIM03007.1 Uncharacterised protein [Mycobacteroides abscessus subsp. abscessus]SLC78406.1 Uncharacterised protein [Mycobacteroides abscessus subsp. abscessus]